MAQLNIVNNITISDLMIGKSYSNTQINQAFGCSTQGGMNRSHATNSLVLFVKHNKSLYDDQWDGDILNYTGMGTTGDQDINYGQNRTLNESNNNGITVYLFECFRDNEYFYDGIVELAAKPFYAVETDANHNLRKVVKFPLRFKNSSGKKTEPTDEMLDSCKKEKKAIIKKIPDDKLRAAAKNAGSKNPKKRTSSSSTYDRNELVSEHTKRRANGKCDLCSKNAPFKKNGEPYLECHHVIQLAKGGPDEYYNTVALCPNCHRKVHILNREKDLKVLKSKIKSYLEEDNDIESLNEFISLFGVLK